MEFLKLKEESGKQLRHVMRSYNTFFSFKSLENMIDPSMNKKKAYYQFQKPFVCHIRKNDLPLHHATREQDVATRRNSQMASVSVQGNAKDFEELTDVKTDSDALPMVLPFGPFPNTTKIIIRKYYTHKYMYKGF